MKILFILVALVISANIYSQDDGYESDYSEPTYDQPLNSEQGFDQGFDQFDGEQGEDLSLKNKPISEDKTQEYRDENSSEGDTSIPSETYDNPDPYAGDDY